MKKAVTAANCCDKHPSHQGQLTRLKRAAGQIDGIMTMIDDRRYCPDIIMQLRAVRSALLAVEGQMLDAHLAACVSAAFEKGSEQERQQKIAELTKLYTR